MRQSAGTTRLVAGLLALPFLLAACDQPAVADTGPVAAATAGRACQLIEYGPVASVLGVTFDSAGGAHQGETYTCALVQSGQTYPDLTLAMTATTLDELFFRATVIPSGAAAVPQLGRIAYQVGLAPVTASDGTASGGGIEVGWLSTANKLMFLRYTLAAGATPEQVAVLTPALVALAKQIEAQLVAKPTLS